MSKQYGCQQSLVRDKSVLPILEYLCSESNKLTNCGIYLARQYLFKANKFLRKFDLINHLKINPHYSALHSQAAQQVLIAVAESFLSYKRLLQAYRRGELENKPASPSYRKKAGLQVIAYPKQALKLVNDKIRIPLGNKVKAWFGIDSFLVNLPPNIQFSSLKELRILPRNRCFYIEYVYPEVKTKIKSRVKQSVMGIDHGLNNWLTCLMLYPTVNGHNSFIIDGKHLKSVNRWYNKQIAKYKENQPQGFWSKRLARITEKRNRQMKDAVNKVARHVVNIAIDFGIEKIIFGWNKGQKQNVDMGSKTNQKFVQVPTAKLKDRIKELAQRYSIEYIETEESYTSQASFLGQDKLPTLGEKPEGWLPSGKRIKRGLYHTADGLRINADLNGAGNIIRKVIGTEDLNISGLHRGALTRPTRTRFWATVTAKKSVTARIYPAV